MKITAEEKQKVLKSIIKHLSSSSECTRNEVINGALVCYGFSKREIEKAQGATAKVNYIRSYIGTALTNLISQGDVKVDKSKRYSDDGDVTFGGWKSCFHHDVHGKNLGLWLGNRYECSMGLRIVS